MSAPADPQVTTSFTPDPGLSDLVQDLIPLAIQYGLRLIGFVIVLMVAFRFAAWLRIRVTDALQGRRFDVALSLFLGSLAKWLVIVGAVVGCMPLFGVDTTSFAAVLGAAGLAIGLAFQGTLSNFAAGVMILTFRPFTVGDFVSVGGVSGTVREIGLFTVSIDTLDNRRIILPNSKVTEGTIENVTANAIRRVDIKVGVAYSSNLDQVRKTLDAAAKSIEGRDPEQGHQVFLAGLGDSAIEFQVRVWCKTEEYWNVWDRTVQNVKEALEAEKISIPFPQVDLHVRDMPAQPRAAS